MAVSTAKISAKRDEETKVEVEIPSSMIHPNPASSVEEFHAESVNTEYCEKERGLIIPTDGARSHT